MPVSNLGRIGFVTKGDWSAGNYKYLDVVKHNQGTWICAVPTTTQTPGAGADWQNALTTPEVTGIANWSQLSGAQSPPLIVYDDQKYWTLIATVSDITANKPSESPDFFKSNGLIDDAVTSELTTWSSEKVDEELGTKVEMDDIRDAYDVEPRTSVQPTISSDFSSNEHKLYEQYGLEPKTITQMYDVARASTATYVDATGKIRTAGVDQPRIDYSSGQGRLLVEEQRTNLLLWSEDFGVSSNLSSGVSLEPFDIGLGNGQGAKFVQSSSTEIAYKSGAEAETLYTLSVFVKMDDGLPPSLDSQLSSSSPNVDFVLNIGGGPATSPYTIQDMGGGIFRVSASRTTGDSFHNNSGVVKRPQNSVRGFVVNGIQLEQASTPSSYIPTEASAVTRAADNVSRVLGDEFNQNEGTVLIETTFEDIRRPSGSFITAITSWGEDRRTNTFTLVTQDSSRGTLQLRGYPVALYGTVAATNILSGETSGKCKIAVSYFGNGQAILAVNGISFTDQNSGQSWPTVLSNPELMIGKLGRMDETIYSPPVLNIAKHIYFPKAFSEQECEELTKL